MKTRFLVVASIVGVLALHGLGCSRTEPAPATTRSAQKEVFLPEIPGFKRGTPEHFKDPKLGYAVGYTSEHKLAVSIYVYNRGLTSIPEGLSDLARNEAANAKGDVMSAEKTGFWKDVKVVREGDVKVGDKPDSPGAAMIEMTMRSPKQEGVAEMELNSTLYVTGYANLFVKIRCTGLANVKEHEAERQVMLKAMGEALVR